MEKTVRPFEEFTILKSFKILMSDFVRCFASLARVPSITVPSKLNVSKRKTMSPPPSSLDSFSTNNYEINSIRQSVLPRIGENGTDLNSSSTKPCMRKSKSENAVNLDNKGHKVDSKVPTAGRPRRKSSAPLEVIHEHFGSTRPPRALFKKAASPIKEKDARIIEQLRFAQAE